MMDLLLPVAGFIALIALVAWLARAADAGCTCRGSARGALFHNAGCGVHNRGDK